MTQARMAPAMGLTMGAMVPAMAHGSMGGVGAAFVLGHVAVLAGVGALALVVPGLRARVAAHRPTRATALRMTGGAAVGFAVVCAHCLLTWHGSV